MGHKIPKSYIAATHRCQNSGVCTITFLLEQVGTSTSHLPPPVCSGPFELTCYSALYVTAKSGLVTKSCMNRQPKGKQKLRTFFLDLLQYITDPILFPPLQTHEPGSSVSVVSGYGLDDRTIEV
jgi:hypothetical protein